MFGAGELSLEQAPPFGVPLRYFLTAPLFGVAAALLLVVAGPVALTSRWSGLTLALTHLLTLGVLAQVMVGALLQMLPVLAGAPVARVAAVGQGVHALMTAGTLGLAWGFWRGAPVWLVVGGLTLAVAFTLLIVALGFSLWRAPRHPVVARGMALALLALGVTVALGVVLALERAGWLHLGAGLAGVDLHAGWGLIGWVGGLIVAVAGEVLPLFYVTPPTAPARRRGLLLGLLLGLPLWSLARSGDGVVAEALLLTLGGGFALFAVLTLRQIRDRQRRLADVTLRYWQVGLGALLACAALGAVGWLWRPLAAHTAFPLLLVGGYLLGFVLSVASGMLDKIVPFLAWFHLHSRQLAPGAAPARVPSMRELLPEGAMVRQYRLHLATLALFPLAVLWPEWGARPVGVVLAGACALLFLNLLRVARRCRLPVPAAP